MRLIKICLLIIFFVCSIVFFVQNMTTLSQPLVLRFDPLPTFSQADTPIALPSAALTTDSSVAPAVAATPTESVFSWKSDGIPMYIVVLASFVVGVLLSCAFFLIDRIRSGYRIIGKKRQIRVLEKEVKRLQEALAKAETQGKVTVEALEGATVRELPPAGTAEEKN